jgi:hypothetical protein
MGARSTAKGRNGVIAHASGFNWDEALLIFGPVAVIIGLLAMARRRGQRPEATPSSKPGP